METQNAVMDVTMESITVKETRSKARRECATIYPIETKEWLIRNG